MKMLTALLVAVALLSPALAQKPTFQGTHPRPKPVIVAPASKPMLLHTGKTITADQKRQLATTVVKNSMLRAPAGTTTKVINLNQSASPTVLTAEQTFMNGANLESNNPYIVNEYAGYLTFMPGDTHSLSIYVPADINTVYTLAIKVNIYSIQNPQMTIVTPNNSVQSSETLSLSYGDNEFVYAFAAHSAGVYMIILYSPNSNWAFESCQITSSAF